MSQCKNSAKENNSRAHDLKLKLKDCLAFLNSTSRYIFFSPYKKGIRSWKAKQKLKVDSLGFEVMPLGWARCFWERKFRRKYRWTGLHPESATRVLLIWRGVHSQLVWSQCSSFYPNVCVVLTNTLPKMFQNRSEELNNRHGFILTDNAILFNTGSFKTLEMLI